MNSVDHAHHHMSPVRKQKRQQLMIGLTAGAGIGLALVLGMMALANAGDPRTSAANMPGAQVLAQR